MCRNFRLVYWLVGHIRFAFGKTKINRALCRSACDYRSVYLREYVLWQRRTRMIWWFGPSGQMDEELTETRTISNYHRHRQIYEKSGYDGSFFIYSLLILFFCARLSNRARYDGWQPANDNGIWITEWYNTYMYGRICANILEYTQSRIFLIPDVFLSFALFLLDIPSWTQNGD